MSKKKVEEALPACEFTIDPTDKEFKQLRSVCDPGNPWRCLIATTASMKIGKRVTVRLDHEEHKGIIGLTHGALRYERPMTDEEVLFATKFDMGERMRKPLTVKIDLKDGSWKAKPKQKGGACKQGRTSNRVVHTIRARQLAVIREQHAATAS